MMEQQQDVGILKVGSHWVRFSEIIVIEHNAYMLGGIERHIYQFTMKGTDKVITVSKEEFEDWLQLLQKQEMTKEK